MAARGHVQDPNDRRLRPIYDYLDNGNNKMAIQQAEKLLKKHRDLHCAKVLKAIGLQRTGKQDEAFTLAQEVAGLEPTDDNSLQALTILYREMHRPELVTKLYEAAVRKVPTSEEYHSHLFMAYARVGEYKKMQQAGMALYKIVPKNPYYFWSVMSLVMQAISAQDEKLSHTMFLPLAERMVEKMVKEEKIEAEAEVQLYFMILERLGKYAEALEVVRGQLGEKLTSELQSRENKCMFLYGRLEQWPECNALSRKLLLKNPDDWQFYLSYFDSLFNLIDQSWTPPEEGNHSAEGEVHCSVAQAIGFVEERLASEEVKETRPLRGPYLARLELISRLRQRGSPDEQQLGEPLELMFQYFVKFGDKPCCFTDLKVFLHLLSPDHYVQFVNRLTEAVPLGPVGEDGVALPGDTRALQRHLGAAQLSRCLGLQHALSTDGKLALIHELRAHYRHGLQFGTSCLKTELQFSDMYCLMAAHVYIDLWIETGKEHVLWQCLGLLEEGLAHSPSNAQIKLLLLLLFCRLGAFEPVVDLYSSLDAKHVQHDTIGYLLTRYAESLGQFAAASQACNFSLRFFHSNQKDTSEYIIQAYKYGAFEKIPEFIAFRNRLNNSLHFAQVRTERMLLDLYLDADISSTLEESVKNMSLCPEEDDIPWDSLRDNRDLDVFVSWNPKVQQLSKEHRQLSLEEESLWLRLRSLTLRLAGCLSGLCHSPQAPPPATPHAQRNAEKSAENGVASKPADMQPLLGQLERTLGQAAQFTDKHAHQQYPFLGPPPTRLPQALANGSCQCQLVALQLPLHVQELETSGLDQSAELQAQIANLFKSLTVQLQDMLNKCKGDLLEVTDGRCRAQPSLLENLVFFVETVCVVLWVSSHCSGTLRPLKSSLQKKKKKKKETSTVTPVVLSGFQEFTASLQTLLSQAVEQIQDQESSLTALKLEALSLEGLPQAEDERTFIKAAMDKVQSSYLRSLQEVGDLLRKRADTLKSLKI
ncbi:N-alpha-acetyltransferase 25, NatB auxiliary subunit isoform X1 [Electrophorus electricus]|uniref:N-alpha-acetyltransferase 25, NatB auxiliary subunit isoform X1 n=1 Tax=Electrophorus electricus TaxID=8005 RepID=UPI0015D06F01|nr:N-alpha-acetyltransferase 25, NatB auxiliary subunit isoform X1 [Electrophorus electricus]